MKEIWIKSRVDMAAIAEAEPGKYHILIIRDPNEEESPPGEPEFYQRKRETICRAADSGMKNAKSYEVIYFHDFWQLSPGVILATKEDIKKALEYAEDKETLIVACAAGISRSSATAYTIARKNSSVSEAMSILNKEVHWPNPHVLNLGGEILGLPLAKEIYDAGFERKPR